MTRNLSAGVTAAAVTVGSIALALAIAPTGRGGPVIDRASQALATDPVYVDAQAQPGLSAADERRVEEAISEHGAGPIYVAVLPAAARAEAGGDVVEALRELAREVDRRGVYAVVADGQFRAGATGATGLEQGEAAELAAEAYEAHSDDGLAATLVDFVDRVGEARASDSGADEDGGGGGFPWWLAILGAGGLGYLVVRRRRRDTVRQESFAAVKQAAHEDLIALATDVQALEEEVEGNAEAKAAYLAALDHYSRASATFDRARTPMQLEPVAKALEEGRYEMAAARAALAGVARPERRAACFFDPRHGPSVRDVPWSPDGGATRDVPACAACALRIEDGGEPESRQVLAGGRSMPYWAAGPTYGSYFGGFFPALLLGQIVGGGFGGFGGSDGPAGSGDDQSGDGGWGDSGDLGGGFGGGDFGGGDFGGGGGDFGGGGGD